MKVPYDQGLAAHIDPESYVYARKGISEALTVREMGTSVLLVYLREMGTSVLLVYLRAD